MEHARNECQAQQACPELDAFIAGAVGRPGSYSTDMGDAWRVVEFFSMQQGYSSDIEWWRGPGFKAEHEYLTQEGYPIGSTCWFVDVAHRAGGRAIVCADAPALAVCRAAWFASGGSFDR